MNASASFWSPTPEQVRQARMTAFAQFVKSTVCPALTEGYEPLYQFSLEQPGPFWWSVWNFCGVLGSAGPAQTNPAAAFVPGPHMTKAQFFPQASLNFAENLLRPDDCRDPLLAERPALLYVNETDPPRAISRQQLLEQATALAAWLKNWGLKPQDRVAAVVPNHPAAVIGMLGTTALGGIWSSCSPEFGEDAICDRFKQIAPRVLVTTATAQYNGKSLSPLDKVRALLPQLPSVELLIIAGNATGAQLAPLPVPHVSMQTLTQNGPSSFEFEPFPFRQPVYILYSSGTTGPPKCIVHGAGGTLLQHLKEHQLHCDLRPQDRLFYYTTTGWMMWNWLVTSLASGATAVLYDGSPFFPNAGALLKMASDLHVTHFGAGAKVYSSLEKLGYRAHEEFDLSALRCILSTGSPLLPESFDYIAAQIKPTQVASISGGTDLISCFVLGCPTLPVHRGEIQCKGLGMDVQVWSDSGQPVHGEPGELVCARPFPSMPVGFWNDPLDKKYLDSYFTGFGSDGEVPHANVWRHGDYAQETATGGMLIFGRSDTTLNPGGVRIGTAELYRQVEAFPQIVEAVATAHRQSGDERIVLFVRMQPEETLTDALKEAIRERLRTRCSARHVPAEIIAAPDFPRTISGKLSEVAVRQALHHETVKNAMALANPESLEFFRKLFA